MERIKGSRHNTLVNIVNEYMGSQWALFMPTLVNASSEPRGKHRRLRSTSFTLVFGFRFFKDC